MTNFWFIGDTHFGHRNIIKYCKRPFSDVQEQDEVMVANWNALIKPGDVVWHHGDFGFFKTPEEGNKVLARLNGAITLIKGNHDSSKIINKMKFQNIIMLKEWRVPPSNVKMVTMCHYPMDCYRGSHRGEWHTHGHTHAMLGRGHRLRLDVGVDSKLCKKGEHPRDRFRPLHLDEVIKEFRRQEKAGWQSEVDKHDFPDWKDEEGQDDANNDD